MSQLRHEFTTSRRQDKALLSLAAIYQLAFREPLFLQTRDDLRGGTLGHTQCLDQFGVARLGLVPERAQRYPFRDSHPLHFQQLLKTQGHVVGYEAQPEPQVVFQSRGRR